jgi:hypothetical protein
LEVQLCCLSVVPSKGSKAHHFEYLKSYNWDVETVPETGILAQLLVLASMEQLTMF